MITNLIVYPLMLDIIELTLASKDGVVDCRLEIISEDEPFVYAATILYPHIINGFSRSEIYCYNMRYVPATGECHFETGENDIHPNIQKLEEAISFEVHKALKAEKG